MSCSLAGRMGAGSAPALRTSARFFASSALYPLWRVEEASPLLHDICMINPFTYAVELIRFAFYGQLEPLSLAVVVGCTVVFLGLSVLAYDPGRGLLARRGGAGE